MFEQHHKHKSPLMQMVIFWRQWLGLRFWVRQVVVMVKVNVNVTGNECNVSQSHRQYLFRFREPAAVCSISCLCEKYCKLTSAAPRWLPGLHCCFFDLQWPLLRLATGEGKDSKMWRLIRWTVRGRWWGTRASRQNWSALGGLKVCTWATHEKLSV